jgi:hypothetical protein
MRKKQERFLRKKDMKELQLKLRTASLKMTRVRSTQLEPLPKKQVSTTAGILKKPEVKQTLSLLSSVSEISEAADSIQSKDTSEEDADETTAYQALKVPNNNVDTYATTLPAINTSASSESHVTESTFAEMAFDNLKMTWGHILKKPEVKQTLSLQSSVSDISEAADFIQPKDTSEEVTETATTLPAIKQSATSDSHVTEGTFAEMAFDNLKMTWGNAVDQITTQINIRSPVRRGSMEPNENTEDSAFDRFADVVLRHDARDDPSPPPSSLGSLSKSSQISDLCEDFGGVEDGMIEDSSSAVRVDNDYDATPTFTKNLNVFTPVVRDAGDQEELRVADSMESLESLLSVRSAGTIDWMEMAINRGQSSLKGKIKFPSSTVDTRDIPEKALRVNDESRDQPCLPLPSRSPLVKKEAEIVNDESRDQPCLPLPSRSPLVKKEAEMSNPPNNSSRSTSPVPRAPHLRDSTKKSKSKSEALVGSVGCTKKDDKKKKGKWMGLLKRLRH